ncbi:MAG: YfdX family protein [Vampirovibrio sp.]|nr:YfdX family protein [Vampirovibrio sp.]
MSKEIKLLSGLLAATLFSGVVAPVALAGPGQLQEHSPQQRMMTPAGTQQPASIISARAYQRIVEARSALHQNELNQASQALQEATRLLSMAQTATPAQKVKNQLWVAQKHLEFETVQEVQQDLIPLETSLLEIENVVPVELVREHLRRAKTALQAGNRPQAKQELQLAENQLVFSESALPLATALSQITQAQNLLTQNEPKQADTLLRQAEQRVEAVAILNDIPVTAATRALGQAAFVYNLQDRQTAQQQVQRAAQAIEQTVQTTEGPTKQVAENLAKEIESVQTRLQRGHRISGRELTGLHQRVGALAAYQQAELTWTTSTPANTPEAQAKAKAKADLYQARLDLALAESYQLTSGDKSKASTQLRAAEAALKGAAMKAQPAVKSQITSIESDVSKLKTGVNLQPTAPVRSTYQNSQQTLQQLILGL